MSEPLPKRKNEIPDKSLFSMQQIILSGKRLILNEAYDGRRRPWHLNLKWILTAHNVFAKIKLRNLKWKNHRSGLWVLGLPMLIQSKQSRASSSLSYTLSTVPKLCVSSRLIPLEKLSKSWLFRWRKGRAYYVICIAVK